MSKVISIYEAKTHLSKLVKQAQAGKTIYIGAYGQVQAVIAPVPSRKPVPIGVWARKKQADAYEAADLISPDVAVSADFERSLRRSAKQGL